MASDDDRPAPYQAANPRMKATGGEGGGIAPLAAEASVAGVGLLKTSGASGLSPGTSPSVSDQIRQEFNEAPRTSIRSALSSDPRVSTDDAPDCCTAQVSSDVAASMPSRIDPIGIEHSMMLDDRLLLSRGRPLVGVTIVSSPFVQKAPAPQVQEWRLLPATEWSDEFSPKYSNGGFGFCEGDPAADEPPPAIRETCVEDPDTGLPERFQYAENEVLVHFKLCIHAHTIRRILSYLGLRILYAWFDPDPDDPDSHSWFHVQVTRCSAYYGDTAGIIAQLRCLPEVADAGYNAVCPFDAGDSQLATDVRNQSSSKLLCPKLLKAVDVWPIEIGSGNNVAVIVMDNGVDITHPDLVDAIYKKDGVRVGINVATAKGQVLSLESDNGGHPNLVAPPSPKQNPSWFHGTAVGGVIAARFNQAGRMVGCAPGLHIFPVKLTTYGTAGAIASSIKAATKHIIRDITKAGFPEVRVVNTSLRYIGLSATDVKKLRTDVGKDYDANHLLWVASAGNLGKRTPQKPAAWSSVLGVTAVNTPTTLDPTTRVPFFGSGQGTNYWYQKAGVDDEAFHNVYGISALWTAMNTTVPVGTGANNGNYLEGVGGTSMSAPMIAALAGLLFARQGDRTTAEVMNIIKLANTGANGETSQLYNDIVVQKTKTRKAGKIPGVVDYTRALPQ